MESAETQPWQRSHPSSKPAVHVNIKAGGREGDKGGGGMLTERGGRGETVCGTKESEMIPGSFRQAVRSSSDDLIQQVWGVLVIFLPSS